MRSGWRCLLLEAQVDALGELQVGLERLGIACRRSPAGDAPPVTAEDPELVLVLQLDGAGPVPPRPQVEAWQAAGRTVLALCREHDPSAMMLAASLAADDILTFPFDERELLRRLERLAELAALERERRVRARLLAAYRLGRYDLRWPRLAPAAVPVVCVLGDAGAARAHLIDALPPSLIIYVESPERLGTSLVASPPDMLLLTRPDHVAAAMSAIEAAGTPVGMPTLLAAYHGPPALDALPPAMDLLGLPAPAQLVRTRLRTALRFAHLRLELRRPPQADGPNLVLDSLTGLYNAGLLLDYLTLERCYRQPALIGVQLDNLREINAQHGHAAGNLALAELGRHLGRATRPDDLACHLGAGRFVVAVSSGGPIQAGPMRRRLEDLLARSRIPACRLTIEPERLPFRGEPSERLGRLFKELSRLRRAA